MATDYFGDFAAVPVNTMPDPDVDEAAGFDVKPGDSGAAQFFKGLQSSMYRNSPEGKQMTQEAIKARLAMKLQEQLEEMKYKLAQQHPEYQQFFKTDLGAIVGVTKYGDQKTVYEDPQQAAYAAKKREAEMADLNMKLDPEVQKAEREKTLLGPAREQSAIDANKALAGYRDKNFNLAEQKAATAEAPPILTPQAEQPLRRKVMAKLLGASEGGRMLDFQWDAAVKKNPALQQALEAGVEEEKRAYYMQRRGGGLASPPQQQQSPPDLTGLMSPLQVD